MEISQRKLPEHYQELTCQKKHVDVNGKRPSARQCRGYDPEKRHKDKAPSCIYCKQSQLQSRHSP